jgi:uncharacterized protein
LAEFKKNIICRQRKRNQGIQIDMMIERADNCMNLLEVKFHDKELVISKDYEQELREKVAIFREQTRTRKSIFITMLSAFGVKRTNII